MENSIIIFIHVVAAGLFVGSCFFGLIIFLPALEKNQSEEPLDENSVAYKMMDRLGPTLFVAILLLFGSGVYYLMENYTDQVNLKPGYYNLFGVKMVLVIISFFLSAYQTFALRGKIANLDLSPENRKLVPSALKKMRTLSVVNLWVVTLAIFLGVWLARF